MNKIKALLLGLILAVALAPIGARMASADPPETGNSEQSVSFSQAVTLGTAALVMTAVSTKAHNVRTLVITNSASGVVRLYSSSVITTGGNCIGAFGVIANTPLPLPVEILRNGLITRKGDGLYVDAATGTLSLQMSVSENAVSPKQ